MKIKQIAHAIVFAAAFSLPAIAADVDPTDQRFVDQAGVAGSTEIAASRLALKQSQDPDIHAFAKQMIEGHTKLANKLAATAKAEGAVAPSDLPDTNQINSLKPLNGLDFDRAYIQQIALEGHRKAIDLFTQEATAGHDAALKQVAQTALPEIRHHREMAEQLAGKKKIAAQ